jgi:phosphohistidine swiveling domain-containing protein
MRPLDECADWPDAGGKAQTLARLRRAGLPVLDGVVVMPDEPLDGLAAIGVGPWAVRSSAQVEGDGAAGVFESIVGVPGGELAAACARVRASGQSVSARAWFATRGVTAPTAISVLIQPVCGAPRFGVASSDGAAVVVEERDASQPEWSDVDRGPAPRGLAEIVARVRAVVGAEVDVEYALDGERAFVLQARPRVAPLVTHGEAPDGFELDATHNPAPLSAAQSALVELTNGLGVGARQCVVGSWLFVEKTPARARSEWRDLATNVSVLETWAEERLAKITTLDEAVAAYLDVWRRWAVEISGLASAARQALDEFLQRTIGEPLGAHGDLLAGIGGFSVERDELLWRLAHSERVEAELVARFGVCAPAWDVAAPCDEENAGRRAAQAAAWARSTRPSSLNHDAHARAKQAASELATRAPGLPPLLLDVRQALACGENDDLIFFAAQRAVRRALLALGDTLVAAGRLDRRDDIFDIAWDLRTLPDGDLRALAAQGQAARLKAARTAPATVETGRLWRGWGTSGVGRGPAFVVRDPAAAPSRLPLGAALVVPALLPSLSYLLPEAAALVTAHGGIASHGATLAREYGIPAVIGARGALDIPDGAALVVDGDRGVVVYGEALA